MWSLPPSQVQGNPSLWQPPGVPTVGAGLEPRCTSHPEWGPAWVLPQGLPVSQLWGR